MAYFNQNNEVVEMERDFATLTVSGLAVKSGLRKTRSDVRRILKQGGLQINGKAIDDDINISEEAHLLHGKYLLLKVGKK